MPRTRFGGQSCSVARALERVGEWWSLLILRDVFYGIRRFEPLRAQLGISRKILTQRLATLVEAGVLERRAYQVRPARFEYRLTPMGVDLFPVLMALARWGDRWLAGAPGPPLHFVHTRCGRPTQPVLHCAHCGDELGAHNVRSELGPGAESRYVDSVARAAGRPVFGPRRDPSIFSTAKDRSPA